MNIGVLLNRRSLLVSSAEKLNTLIRTSNRAQIIAKSFLLSKKKELSDTRAKAFSSLKRQSKDDNANLLGIGAGIGGGASLLRKGKPKVTKGIGKVKGLGRLSRTNVLLNTAFTAADFMGRKSSGQTNLQAGVGAGAGLLGGLGGFTAGAKIGASIGALGGPVGIAIGGLLGGAVGSFAGSSLASGAADRATGVTGSNFRRRELERQEVRINKRTEFTVGLDSFDKALDRFRKYDEDLKAFILRATGRDKDNQALKPFLLGPFGRGGATQSDVDKAYSRGIATGVYRTVGAVIMGAGLGLAGAAVIKAGALILSKKFLLSLLKGTLAKKILGKKFQFGLMKGKVVPFKPIQFKKGGIFKKKTPVKSKVTKGGTKPGKKKILRAQDQVTYSDETGKIIKKYDQNKPKFERIQNKSTNEDVQNIIRKGTELDLLNKKLNKQTIIKNQRIIKKYQKNRVIQKNLFRKKENFDTTNKDLSDVRIINEGNNGNNIAFNSDTDPYLGTINTIKAYSELTA
jgi:hypothetical protein